VRDHRFLSGSLALVVAASGFGVLGPVARLAYEAGFQPMAFVAWRAAFGVLAILAIVAGSAVGRGIPIVNPLRLPRGDAVALAVIALTGLAVNIATFVAFDLTTVALVLLAFYTYPALVAGVAVALGHERLDGTHLAALGLALGGMVLVVAGGLDPAGGDVAFNPLGVLLGLAAAVFQTTFVTVSRGRFAAIPSEQAMGWVLLLIAVACTGSRSMAVRRSDWHCWQASPEPASRRCSCSSASGRSAGRGPGSSCSSSRSSASVSPHSCCTKRCGRSRSSVAPRSWPRRSCSSAGARERRRSPRSSSLPSGHDGDPPRWDRDRGGR
jgi:drug/metabolite transporter (DMT)-like permease